METAYDGRSTKLFMETKEKYLLTLHYFVSAPVLAFGRLFGAYQLCVHPFVRTLLTVARRPIWSVAGGLDACAMCHQHRRVVSGKVFAQHEALFVGSEYCTLGWRLVGRFAILLA